MAKDETPKVTRNIPYRYVCEHCGAQTEWKNSHVTGDSDIDIDQTVIPHARDEAAKGNFYELNGISGTCDHCGRRQSWELGEAKAWMKRSPLMGLGLGGMIGGVGAFASAFLFGLLGAFLIFIGLAVLGMIGAFIYGLARYIAIKGDMGKTTRRHMPEVVWQVQQVRLEPAPTIQANLQQPVTHQYQ